MVWWACWLVKLNAYKRDCAYKWPIFTEYHQHIVSNGKLQLKLTATVFIAINCLLNRRSLHCLHNWLKHNGLTLKWLQLSWWVQITHTEQSNFLIQYCALAITLYFLNNSIIQIVKRDRVKWERERSDRERERERRSDRERKREKEWKWRRIDREVKSWDKGAAWSKTMAQQELTECVWHFQLSRNAEYAVQLKARNSH